MWAPLYASPRGVVTPTRLTAPSLSRELAVEMDRQQIEEILKSRGSPCLLDCMELLLEDVDVFSARKLPLAPTSSTQDGFAYRIERDVCAWVWSDSLQMLDPLLLPHPQHGEVLGEKGALKLTVERNLHEDFCRNGETDIHAEFLPLAALASLHSAGHSH